MKFARKIIITFIAALFTLTIPLSVMAETVVPWSSEVYRAYAYAEAGALTDEDEQFGPPLAISASAYADTNPEVFSVWDNTQADASVTASTMSATVWTNLFYGLASASFLGTFTAPSEQFVFAFSGYIASTSNSWITISDLTSSATLYDSQLPYYQENPLFVPITVGHNIQVSFGVSSYYDENKLENYYTSVDPYTPSAPVAPEPVSSTLFIVGGLLFAGRMFRKN